MAFDWKSLVEVAKELNKHAGASGHPEAFYRSALSRAYFGAYGYAREYAYKFLGFVPREASEDHGRLRAHLQRKRRAGDADRVGILRQLRNEADYESALSAPPDWASAVVKAVSLAERVFASLVPPKGSSQST